MVCVHPGRWIDEIKGMVNSAVHVAHISNSVVRGPHVRVDCRSWLTGVCVLMTMSFVKLSQFQAISIHIQVRGGY